MKAKIATVLVGPKTLYREGLAQLLSDTGYRPSNIVTGVSDLVSDRLPRQGELLFVVGTEGSSAPHAAFSELALIRDQFPQARVVVLGGSFDAGAVLAALRAGANGYVLNTTTRQALIAALDLVMCGETVLPSEFARAMHERRNEVAATPANHAATEEISHFDRLGALRGSDQPHLEARRLSRKEMTVLSRLRLGDSNKTIARTVGIAEATVKAHVKAILRKVGVKNRTQAAMWALSNLPQSGQPLSSVAVAGAGGELAKIS
jgi:two-component system, NarL family, nitrate/nitrite response regulator NarL